MNKRLLTEEEVLDNSSGDYGKEEYLALLEVQDRKSLKALGNYLWPAADTPTQRFEYATLTREQVERLKRGEWLVEVKK